MSIEAGTRILTGLAIILLLGIVLTIFSKKIKVSSILMLILTGIVLGQLNSPWFDFSPIFLVAIAILTLVIVVFDGTSRFNLKLVDLYSVAAIKVTMIFLILNILFITLFTTILFFDNIDLATIFFSMLYAILMTGTDPSSVFVLLKSKTNKVIEFLEIEAIINTPIMVIFPFIILDILANLETADVTSIILDQAAPLLKQIVVGIGSGVLIGIVVFRSMKKYRSQALGPITIITAALLSYILAENIEGNGVLAVATLGIFFDKIYLKQKEDLKEFNSLLSTTLVIIVFILIGLIIKIDFTWGFILKSLVLYIMLLLTRLVALSFGLSNQDFNAKEKMFMALSMSKGVALAVVTFSLSVLPIPAYLEIARKTILELILMSLLYSLIFSTVIDRFSQKFIRIKLFKGK